MVIVQVQTWEVAGTQQLKGHILLNGVSLTQTNKDLDGIIKSMSVYEHLPNVISGNLTSVLSIKPFCSGCKCEVSFEKWTHL